MVHKMHKRQKLIESTAVQCNRILNKLLPIERFFFFVNTSGKRKRMTFSIPIWNEFLIYKRIINLLFFCQRNGSSLVSAILI